MTFSSELKSISRRKVRYVKIKGDTCANTFGVSPCTATGTKCYNTFPTCLDTVHFSKTTKDYIFIDRELPLSVITAYAPARPYIKDIDELANEIKEKNTVVKRLKITLYDETDNDVGIDPYVSERSTIQGTFWRKFLARNPNYKGRVIEVYEGFDSLNLSEYQLTFAGKIKNITLESGSVTIEASDFLRELSEIEYPLILPYTLTQKTNKVWNDITSDTDMNNLIAIENDVCERTDWVSIAGFNATSGVTAEGSLSGSYSAIYWVFAYKDGYAIGATSWDNQGLDDPEDNSIILTWTALSGIYTYIVVKREEDGTYKRTTSSLSYSFTDTGNETWETIEDVPRKAERYYIRRSDTVTPLWDFFGGTSVMVVNLSSTTMLDSTGYIQLDKEIMYYSSKTSDTLSILPSNRGLFDTKSEYHIIGTSVKYLYKIPPTNPFQILLDMLADASISSSYISDSFEDYRDAWTGPNASCEPLIKSSKLSDLYFDLVNVLDCISWVGEDGKIYIRKQSDYDTPIKLLTDEANIISGSISRDANESSRFTRWILFWDRFDIQKGLKDKEAYNHVTVTVDVDLEDTDNYGEIVEDLNYSVWLNSTNADTDTYVDDLLAAKKDRTKQAQTILTLQVELKDGDIKLGEIVQVSTNYEQDITGAPLNGYYRVIKKTPKGTNKIELKLLLYTLGV